MMERPARQPLSRSGLIAGFVAFFCWGIFPLYWKAVHWLSSDQAIAVRVVSCVPVLLLFLVRSGEWSAFVAALRSPRLLAWHFLTGAFLGANWLIFVWATMNQQLIQASQGYFLNPLVNVALGAWIFGERMSRLQTVAVILAGVGVGLQTMLTGGVPLVAALVCVSFAFYGVLKKKAGLPSLQGLCVETVVWLPLALAWLGYRPPSPLATGLWQWFLVASMGLVTCVPLLCFGRAARALPLSTLGIIQFLAPTMQFLLGWLVFGESVRLPLVIGFSFIWIGVGLFLLESRRTSSAS